MKFNIQFTIFYSRRIVVEASIRRNGCSYPEKIDDLKENRKLTYAEM